MTQFAQLTFDGFDAPSAKIVAITKVERHADPAWLQMADFAVQQLCRTEAEFTTDDVWEWLDRNTHLRPHEPRAMGAVMRKAAVVGLIEATQRYVQSRRDECHGRPVAVWRVR